MNISKGEILHIDKPLGWTSFNVGAGRPHLCRHLRLSVHKLAGQDLEYVIPKEGTNVWIDSWVIPKNAENVENAEKFIEGKLF